MPAPCRVPRVPSLWGRQTGQAKRKAQHVQEGGRSPQRGGVSGLLANGMAHGRGRLRVAVLVGGGAALAPEAPVAVGTPGGWLAGLGGALAFRVCGAAGLTACLPSQSRTTVSPGTTSCTRRTAKAAPTCWWSTPPPGASAARWTCSWPRPSSSRYPWPPGRDVRAQPTRHRPAVALCSWPLRLGDIATCQLAFTRAAFCAAVIPAPHHHARVGGFPVSGSSSVQRGWGSQAASWRRDVLSQAASRAVRPFQMFPAWNVSPCGTGSSSAPAGFCPSQTSSSSRKRGDVSGGKARAPTPLPSPSSGLCPS